MTQAEEPPPAGGPLPVALYVHFPFCLSICPYCDFVVYAGRAARGPSSRIAEFVDAVVVEVGVRAVSGATLESVYLGGGTPSLLSAWQLERILNAADQAFGIARGAEITVETNPGPDERRDLAGFRAAGVNRVSIGAQSLSDVELSRLGRRHTAEDVAAAVSAAASAGFDNISLDLLYDVPGQTVASWRATLERAVSLAVPHISAYALTLDDPDAEGLTGVAGDHLPLRTGARRWRDVARREQDDGRAAQMYRLADGMLSRAGLAWYELSNWAQPGRESRHNVAYWNGRPWEAAGPGAHAFDGVRTRRWNAARLDGYLAALLPRDGSDARLPPGGAETTDEQTATTEQAMLRLRTRAGLPLGLRAQFADQLAWGRANRLVERAADGSARLTMRGRLLSNELFTRLLLPTEIAAA